MKRKRLTELRKAKLFIAHGGVCHICNTRINSVHEKWEIEHVIPLAMGGADDESNMAPAHIKCHRGKTDDDVKAVAKAKRNEARHIGAKSPSRWPKRGWGRGKPNVKQLEDL